jgi:glycosyltransferase involved in cell wall biosynthesis
MDKKYSVSVAIATYNRRFLLEKALTSVFNQSYHKPIQIVIQDDGSNDGTEEYILSLKNDNIFYEKDINRGRIIARNKAIKRCVADIIMILDSDDEWHSEKVAKQMPYFYDPSIDYVYSLVKDIDLNGNYILRGGVLDTDITKLHALSMPISTIAVRKLVFAKHMIFDEFYLKYKKFGFEHAEHTDFVYKLQVSVIGKFINEPLAIYKSHNDKVAFTNPVFISFTDLAATIRLTQLGYMKVNLFRFMQVLFRTFKRVISLFYKIYFKKT